MNQPYVRVNQPYATLTLASPLREMFGVPLYKNNARALLSRILSILNLDWLQHARSVRGVYECTIRYWSPQPSYFIHLAQSNYAKGPSIVSVLWYVTILHTTAMQFCNKFDLSKLGIR